MSARGAGDVVRVGFGVGRRLATGDLEMTAVGVVECDGDADGDAEGDEDADGDADGDGVAGDAAGSVSESGTGCEDGE